MAFTSKQIDALQQRAEADDALIHAFGEDYPTAVARIEADAIWLKEWADSSPAPESKP
jgi:hypothetical protein